MSLKATVVRKLLGIGILIAGITAAQADSAPAGNPFIKYANPYGAVAAVHTIFDAEPGKSVRIAVYDSEEAFLENALTKLSAPLDATGLALVPLGNLAPGEYAFAVYLDENGDGKLNRGKLLGRPKEPVAFSNGAKAKLRKPHFDEAKVVIAPGEVVVITLDD
jgi:uncharacterized protein (DUF2141 family)